MSDGDRAGATLRLFLRIAIATVALMLGTAGRAFAADDTVSSCVGPLQCCPGQIQLQGDAVHVVQLGAVLVGIYEINDKASTWNADFYLYEQWIPATGFVPQTEIVNEVERKAVQFDTTQLRDDHCTRTRRIHSTLRTYLNLHTFPFDHQSLAIQLSDAEFSSQLVKYSNDAVAGLDDTVAQELVAWGIESPLRYGHVLRTFRWDPGAPEYDYATFSVTVERQFSYHLSKYFLPLLLIVIVSFSVFWIDSSDLASEVQIGVTCLLAVVALQFAEASDLPDVSYLTIADRTYAACYVAIALAVLQSVYTNRLVRAGRADFALRVDGWSRRVFPAVLVVSLGLAIVRAYMHVG